MPKCNTKHKDYTSCESFSLKTIFNMLCNCSCHINWSYLWNKSYTPAQICFITHTHTESWCGLPVCDMFMLPLLTCEGVTSFSDAKFWGTTELVRHPTPRFFHPAGRESNNLINTALDHIHNTQFYTLWTKMFLY